MRTTLIFGWHGRKFERGEITKEEAKKAKQMIQKSWRMHDAYAVEKSPIGKG